MSRWVVGGVNANVLTAKGAHDDQMAKSGPGVPAPPTPSIQPALGDTMIINLTPHAVTIGVPSGQGTTYPPSGIVARLAETVTSTDSAGISTVDYGTITDLPDPSEGTLYLVSLACALAARDDLLVAYDQIRDDQGRIVGARHLARVTVADRAARP